jgi:hypothetical protein
MPRLPITDPDKRHRRPVEIISPGVWRNFRFRLGDRGVTVLTAERGVGLTFEAARCWSRK